MLETLKDNCTRVHTILMLSTLFSLIVVLRDSPQSPLKTFLEKYFGR